MQLHITKVFRSDKKKDGTPLIGRSGKPYTKVSIKTIEYGDRWVGGFGGQWNSGWKEGDVVDIEVEDTGQYLNFNRPDPLKSFEQRLKNLEARVLQLENPRQTMPSIASNESPPDLQDGEINVEDIPF